MLIKFGLGIYLISKGIQSIGDGIEAKRCKEEDRLLKQTKKYDIDKYIDNDGIKHTVYRKRSKK